MQKIKYVIYLFFFLLLVFLITPAYYFIALPDENLINYPQNSRSVFKNFELQTNEIIASEHDLPNEVFNCAVCFPENINSKSCIKKMTWWISKNLLSGDKKERHIFFSIKTFFLSKSIEIKYLDTTILIMYLTFANRPLGSHDLTEACLKRFNKKCSLLSYEQSISLQAEVYGSQITGFPKYREGLEKKCHERF